MGVLVGRRGNSFFAQEAKKIKERQKNLSSLEKGLVEKYIYHSLRGEEDRVNHYLKPEHSIESVSKGLFEITCKKVIKNYTVAAKGFLDILDSGDVGQVQALLLENETVQNRLDALLNGIAASKSDLDWDTINRLYEAGAKQGRQTPFELDQVYFTNLFVQYRCKGQDETAEKLLKKGTTFKKLDQEKFQYIRDHLRSAELLTADFLHAVEQNDQETLQTFLYENQTVKQYATDLLARVLEERNPNMQLAKKLHEIGANPNETRFFQKLYNRDKKSFLELLEDPNTDGIGKNRELFKQAVFRGDIKTVFAIADHPSFDPEKVGYVFDDLRYFTSEDFDLVKKCIESGKFDLNENRVVTHCEMPILHRLIGIAKFNRYKKEKNFQELVQSLFAQPSFDLDSQYRKDSQIKGMGISVDEALKECKENNKAAYKIIKSEIRKYKKAKKQTTRFGFRKKKVQPS